MRFPALYRTGIERCFTKKTMPHNKQQKRKNPQETSEPAKVSKKKRMAYEWRRIDNYFDWLFGLDGPSEILWNMLKLAITNGEEEAEAKERSNMIFFYENTKELFENIAVLLKKQKDKYKEEE